MRLSPYAPLLTASCALALLLCGLLLVATPAQAADSVTLRSGRTLTIAAHRFEAKGLHITQHVDGGTLGIRLAYRTIAPASLEQLLLAHAAGADAAKRMRLAAIALDAGLPHASERLYAQLAEEPKSAAAANDGLKRARRAVATSALDNFARGIATGTDRALMRTRISVFADGPYVSHLTPLEQRRLAAFARLVEPAPVAATPAAAVEVPAPVAAPDALPAAAQKLRADIDTAHALRERAAEPDMSSKDVRSLLRRAASALRAARKAAKSLPADVPPEMAIGLRAVATDLLVATYVDLAQWHRQAGRLRKAREYVRLALLYRPEHPGALQQRGLIEADIAAAAAYDPYDHAWLPYGHGFESYWIGPAFRRSLFGAYRLGRRPPYDGFGWSTHLGSKRVHGSGPRRGVATRK